MSTWSPRRPHLAAGGGTGRTLGQHPGALYPPLNTWKRGRTFRKGRTRKLSVRSAVLDCDISRRSQGSVGDEDSGSQAIERVVSLALGLSLYQCQPPPVQPPLPPGTDTSHWLHVKLCVMLGNSNQLSSTQSTHIFVLTYAQWRMTGLQSIVLCTCVLMCLLSVFFVCLFVCFFRDLPPPPSPSPRAV